MTYVNGESNDATVVNVKINVFHKYPIIHFILEVMIS